MAQWQSTGGSKWMLAFSLYFEREAKMLWAFNLTVSNYKSKSLCGYPSSYIFSNLHPVAVKQRRCCPCFELNVGRLFAFSVKQEEFYALLLHALQQNTILMYYHTAGKFRGRKLANFEVLWLFANFKVFSANLESWCSSAVQSAIYESFHQFTKLFSCESFPLYGTWQMKQIQYVGFKTLAQTGLSITRIWWWCQNNVTEDGN